MCCVVLVLWLCCLSFSFFFQAEDGIRDLVRSRGLGDVYKRQLVGHPGHPHSVDPALQHGRLAGPPRGVHQHERLAPTQVRGVLGDVGLGLGWCQVVGALPRGELGHEPVSYTHLTLPTIYPV